MTAGSGLRRTDLLDTKAYKVSVTIPPKYKDRLMDAVTDSVRPVCPGYDRTFSVTDTTSTWRSLEGSDPFIGEIGGISIVKEVRIEFAVAADDLRNAVLAIRRVHPYEEPAIDIVPIIPWKDVIGL